MIRLIAVWAMWFHVRLAKWHAARAERWRDRRDGADQ